MDISRRWLCHKFINSLSLKTPKLRGRNSPDTTAWRWVRDQTRGRLGRFFPQSQWTSPLRSQQPHLQLTNQSRGRGSMQMNACSAQCSPRLPGSADPGTASQIPKPPLRPFHGGLGISVCALPASRSEMNRSYPWPNVYLLFSAEDYGKQVSIGCELLQFILPKYPRGWDCTHREADWGG